MSLIRLAPVQEAKEKDENLPALLTTAMGSIWLYCGWAWSVVPGNIQGDILDVLEQIRHAPQTLSQGRYVLTEWSNDKIAGFCKCRRCGIFQKDCFEPYCYVHEQDFCTEQGQYLCCGNQQQHIGCICYLQGHIFPPFEKSETYHMSFYRFTPPFNGEISRNPCPAVAIDCEMVEVEGKRNEVVRVSAVDVLTGDVLIDKYVFPTKKVTNWRSHITGVTEGTLSAMPSYKVLPSWSAARHALWQHIDNGTILVGHALYNDLNVLKMIHHRIVDSAILAREAVHPDCNVMYGLKNLCNHLLGKNIQSSPSGHDSLEDAFAARELVLSYIQDPDLFEGWAAQQR